MKLILSKMLTKHREPILYELGSDESQIDLNSSMNKKIKISWNGVIICRKCKKMTKKSFGEGFCYPCFMDAPEASPCILKPELCQGHIGIGRDLQYEEKNHNQPHAVYLASTDKVKVGVTRSTQIPTRWIDQGANKAIVLAITPNRYLAGVLEVSLKSIYSDKTNWRSMLKNLTDESIDLEEEKWSCFELLPSDMQQYFVEDDTIYNFIYPSEKNPTKVSSINLQKTPIIEGVLTGIKGQYLIFDNEYVFNIRRHTSFEIELNIND